MNKVYDIFATGKDKGTLEHSRAGSGGGGPVEAVYWVRGVMTQWRIRGKCWVIAADDVEGGTDEAQASGVVSMKAELGRYMRKVGANSGNEEWRWTREVENYYENMSPIMRGSFKNPPPGQSLNDGNVGPGERLGQKGGSLKNEPLARKNFRVAVITPEEVEQVDLSDPGNSKRWIWSLAEAGRPEGDDDSKQVGEWSVVETWP